MKAIANRAGGECTRCIFCVLSRSQADANVNAKVGEIVANLNMAKEVAGNYIRAHRRRCGLSQKELGTLVGYRHGYAVGRHERSRCAPPLIVALAYEVVFEIPVGQIFPGFRSVVVQSVARNLEDLKGDLESRASRRRRVSPEKAQWLTHQHIGQ